MTSAPYDLAARVLDALRAQGARAALTGSLACELRGAPQPHREVEVLLDAGADAEVERLGLALRRLGLSVVAHVEDPVRARVASVLLAAHEPGSAVPPVRLCAAGDEAERQVVAASAGVEVEQGVTLAVAARGHLLALAVRAHAGGAAEARARIEALLRVASASDLEQARAALAGLTAPGAGAGSLVAALDALLRRRGSRGTS